MMEQIKKIKISMSNNINTWDETFEIEFEKFFRTSTKCNLDEFNKLDTESAKKDYIYNSYKVPWKYVMVEFIY